MGGNKQLIINNMKLSNNQIRAIIDQIASKEQIKLDADYKKEKDAILKIKKPLAKKYFALYSKLPLELKKLLKNYDGISESSILDSITNVKIKRFDRNDMYNKIIIASIDSKDLDELKKKLKISI